MAKLRRIARTLLKATGWITGTIIIGFLINYTANLAVVQGKDISSTSFVSLVNWLFLPGAHRVIALSVLVPLCILILLSGILVLTDYRDTLSASTSQSRNRQLMLERVRAAWITGVLEQSLYGATLIALGLREQQDAVVNSWRLAFLQPNQPGRLLPPGTSIAKVYRDAGGELLILGEPGSGKTTLLLELARDLLDRAERDDKLQMPVVFNLSSWTTKRQRFAEWLVEELNTKYQVPRKVGQVWVDTDQILPLFDGLDEVPANARAACIDAINAYRQEHMVPIVICSRRAEYLTQAKRVILRNAVVVQPLTAQQIDDYLASAGGQLAAVRVALRQDKKLQELVTTPLMLSVLALAYQGKSVEELLMERSLRARRGRIFATYVQRTLQRQGSSTHYSLQQVTRRLTWLAQQMDRHNETVFYLERIGVDWLPRQQIPRWGYWLFSAPGLLLTLLIGLLSSLLSRQLVGLLFGLLFGLLGWAVGMMIGIWLGVPIAVVLGLPSMLLGMLFLFPSMRRIGLRVFPSMRRFLRLVGLLSSLLGVLLGGSVGWWFGRTLGELLGRLLFDLLGRPGDGLLLSFVFMLVGPLPFVMFFGLANNMSHELDDVLPFSPVLPIWLLFGLFLVLGFVLLFGLGGGLLFSLLLGLGGGLLLGPGSSLLSGEHDSSFSQIGITQRIRLLFGLKSSQFFKERHILFSLLIFSLLFLFMLLFGALGQQIGALPGLLLGELLGLLFSVLIFRGVQALRYYISRLLLWCAGCVPLRYVRFLDYATECVLLRKVGNGYIFIHRLLLDYFRGYFISPDHPTQDLPIVIGIDFGTTNSCVAVMQYGEPVVVPNVEGQHTTPSIVAQTKTGDWLVGETAKRQATVNPENTIFSIHRFIGRKYDDPEIDLDRRLAPYKIVCSTNGDAWVEVQGKPVSPQEISAMILRKLKADAELYLRARVTKAVIAVPTYFNDIQRQVIKDSCRMAGLEVLRTVGTSSITSLAYGLNVKEDKRIAIYDLGGGTFNTSILEIGGYIFEVKSTNGDMHLGGDDFDHRIITWMADEFRKEYGIDLRQDRMALQRLKEAAEKAKKELSSSMQTEINLPFITADASGPKHLTMTLSRAKLEQLVEDLVEKTRGPVMKVLSDAGVRPGDVQEVVLVGGQTHMPAIETLVRRIFVLDPQHGNNAGEGVALGAAIQAGMLTGEVDEEILLLDVTPFSLGIETLGGVFTRLIERNTTIPTQSSQVFSTSNDSQTCLQINVLRGEREFAKDNHSLCTFILDGLPPAPRGTPQIEVTFAIDGDGSLTVSTRDKSSGRYQKVTVEPGSSTSSRHYENCSLPTPIVR